MKLTARMIDGPGGRPYRRRIAAIQRAVGAEERKAAASAKRARRAAKRQGGAS